MMENGKAVLSSRLMSESAKPWYSRNQYDNRLDKLDNSRIYSITVEA